MVEVAPGATIGILGGGQLGRMIALSGRRLGYCFHLFTPEARSPASCVVERETNASFEDEEALQLFSASVERVTLEFENIPLTALEIVERQTTVYPQRTVLGICQNRLREKTFLKQNGFPCAPFMPVDSGAALEQAVNAIGFPCVLKTAQWGYDGKGQMRIDKSEPWERLWEAFGVPLGLVEKWIDYEKEASLICARNERGAMSVFSMAENVHRDAILRTSCVPARVLPDLKQQAIDLARTIAETLEVVGLLTIEFFLTPKEGWLVNELAPRPHNSGHYSLDACLTDQFEQHVRAICGLPLGATDLLRPAVMVNLLGEAWKEGQAPDWGAIVNDPAVKLHLYGKEVASPRRKMGHLCILDATLETALQKATHLQQRLSLSKEKGK